MIQKIEPAAAIRLLDAKKAQAVDVREPDEYAVGHIPGAKLLPLGEVMSRTLPRCCPTRTHPGWSTAAPAAAALTPSRSWMRWVIPISTTSAASSAGPMKSKGTLRGIFNVTESGVARLCAGQSAFSLG